MSRDNVERDYQPDMPATVAGTHPYGANVRYEPAAPPKPGPLYHALAFAPTELRPDGSSGDAELEDSIALQLLSLFRLFKDRQKKYGPGNIAAFGDYGALVRCHDKLARLRKHYVEGTGDMPDESVEDAWSDLAVYAVIALTCRKGRWPGWKGKKP